MPSLILLLCLAFLAFSSCCEAFTGPGDPVPNIVKAQGREFVLYQFQIPNTKYMLVMLKLVLRQGTSVFFMLMLMTARPTSEKVKVFAVATIGSLPLLGTS